MPKSLRIGPSEPVFSDANLERAYGVVAHLCNRHLTDHMRRLSRELEMDLESAFIWGTLAQLNLASALLPGLNPADVLDSEGQVPRTAFRAVRLSDLAQISGLPRETVRRKLKGLQTRGKVERHEDGGWQATAAGIDSNVKAFTAETARRLVATAEQIRQAVVLVVKAPQV